MDIRRRLLRRNLCARVILVVGLVRLVWLVALWFVESIGGMRFGMVTGVYVFEGRQSCCLLKRLRQYEVRLGCFSLASNKMSVQRYNTI